jgi:uncharacterized membrane protein YoaK (UPF0700 family)
MVVSKSQNPLLAVLLSFNGGYIDTAGFLTLHGLFTAHVTGNFVTLGASLALGVTGAVAKILALPTFCIVIIATRLLAFRLADNDLPILRIMLGIKLCLLCIAAWVAVRFGPFPNGDSKLAIVTGLMLVSAMAIQNAAHRVHLGQMPPTTLMTGTTTQMTLDVADLLHGLSSDAAVLAKARLSRMSVSVVAFATGCGLAAFFFSMGQQLCLIAPPVLGAIMLVLDVA